MAVVNFFFIVVFCVYYGIGNPLPLPNHCRIIKTGLPFGHAIPLPTTTLAPGVADWEIYVPNEQCGAENTSGMIAKVCDYDSLPSAKFENKEIYVHRVGHLQGYGSVTTTLYCLFPAHISNQPLISNAPWQSNIPQNEVTSWGQSPSKLWDHSILPSLVATPQNIKAQILNSQWGLSPHPVWSQSPHSSWDQSSLPSVEATPQLGVQSQNSLWGLSHQSVWGQSPQSGWVPSELRSSVAAPQQIEAQISNSVSDQTRQCSCGQLPHSRCGQCNLPSLTATPHDIGVPNSSLPNSSGGQSPQSAWDQTSSPSVVANPQQLETQSLNSLRGPSPKSRCSQCSLPSLTATAHDSQSPQSAWNQSPLPSVVATPQLGVPSLQSRCSQSNLPSLTATPHNIGVQIPNSLGGQSPLPSVVATPQHLEDQSLNSLWGPTPQSARGLSPLPSLVATPKQLGAQSQNLAQ